LNLHSLIVHFPIALLIVATGFDIAGILGRIESALRTGYILLGLGTAAAIAAAVTGDYASDAASGIPGITRDLLRHDDLGTATAAVAILLFLIRTRAVLQKRFVGATRNVYLIVTVCLAGLAAVSGYTGGRLVHRFGAGTLPISEILQVEEPAQTRGLP